jgi:A/G-specific adenine glycosylase
MPKASNSRARRQHAHAGAQAQSPAAADLARRLPTLHERLLAWYRQARRDLPWRRTSDPYAVWLSEVMLQQTRVETVIPYYQRFLEAFPTVHALAEAPLDGVLSLWSGLGYYRRARMLHEAARQVARDRGGAFPDTAEGLAEIKGIGRYTAGAIASIAFGRAAALVDGNVARVLARIFALEDDARGAAGLARIWAIAEALVPAKEPGAWNQALMELGATVCVPRDPRCLVCPVGDVCDARAVGKERELPRLAPKSRPKEVHRLALVATRRGRVLLGRRREEGAFGGMWEPPSIEADGEADATRRFQSLAGIRLGKLERAGAVTHVLSHRRLEVVVLRGRLLSDPSSKPDPEGAYEAFALVAPDAPGARGLSTFARKLLAAAKL